MSSRAQIIALFAAAGSLVLLLTAFGFQHLGGLHPCKMCLWQRWPHAAAVGLGALILFVPYRGFYALGAALAFITAAIGGYHTGVERGWWEGPASCSASDVSGMSADALLQQIMQAPLVRCDEVAWQLAGLSMASWNMLASLALVGLWMFALSSKPGS